MNKLNSTAMVTNGYLNMNFSWFIIFFNNLSNEYVLTKTIRLILTKLSSHIKTLNNKRDGFTYQWNNQLFIFILPFFNLITVATFQTSFSKSFFLTMRTWLSTYWYKTNFALWKIQEQNIWLNQILFFVPVLNKSIVLRHFFIL